MSEREERLAKALRAILDYKSQWGLSDAGMADYRAFALKTATEALTTQYQHLGFTCGFCGGQGRHGAECL